MPVSSSAFSVDPAIMVEVQKLIFCARAGFLREPLCAKKAPPEAGECQKTPTAGGQGDWQRLRRTAQRKPSAGRPTFCSRAALAPDSRYQSTCDCQAAKPVRSRRVNQYVCIHSYWGHYAWQLSSQMFWSYFQEGRKQVATPWAKDSKSQGFKASGIQGLKDSSIKRLKDSSIQGLKAPRMEKPRDSCRGICSKSNRIRLEPPRKGLQKSLTNFFLAFHISCQGIWSIFWLSGHPHCRHQIG